MASSIAPVIAPETASTTPGLYTHIQLLSSKEHSAWSIRSGDYAFAASIPYVQLVASEIGSASNHYPVVFGADFLPLAILSLDVGGGQSDTNLFVREGVWSSDTYVPAFMRRYPFVYVQVGGGYALAIDTASERIDRSGTEGVALFEGDRPTDFTRGALDFCGEYELFLRNSEVFGKALAAKGLLVDRTATANLPEGGAPAPFGFKIVDAELFAKLDTETLADWHGKGWLALVHFHLNSLANFQRLLTRRADRPGAAISGAESAQSAALTPQKKKGE